jgi:hypothetical protein
MHGAAMLFGLQVSGHCRVLMCRRRDSYSSFLAFCSDWGIGVACFVPEGFWQEWLIDDEPVSVNFAVMDAVQCLIEQHDLIFVDANEVWQELGTLI